MLALVIKQNPPPLTRFYVAYRGIWAAFNHFDEVVGWLHDNELDELEERIDLTQDQISLELDDEYLRLTNHLRAV